MSKPRSLKIITEGKIKFKPEQNLFGRLCGAAAITLATVFSILGITPESHSEVLPNTVQTEKLSGETLMGAIAPPQSATPTPTPKAEDPVLMGKVAAPTKKFTEEK